MAIKIPLDRIPGSELRKVALVGLSDQGRDPVAIILNLGGLGSAHFSRLIATLTSCSQNLAGP